MGGAVKYNEIDANGDISGDVMGGGNYVGGLVGRGWVTEATCNIFNCEGCDSCGDCWGCNVDCRPGRIAIRGKSYVGGTVGRLIPSKSGGDNDPEDNDDHPVYLPIVFDECNVWADISGPGSAEAKSHIGGIIGHAGTANYPGTPVISMRDSDRTDDDYFRKIENSSFVGSIRGKNNVGGIMGRGWLDVEDCSVEANITASGEYIG
ncbi:MAG: hypothetical protein FWH04_07490, partial [Oscillospiraceae bacterium]|nr:hypothetical protein [Oscillospiraceae bacterium]